MKNDENKNNVLQKYQKQIVDMCEQHVTDPHKILELIEFKSRFYQYSLNNTVLIYNQRPASSFVQSFAAWNNMGAKILKGEKALKIFTPVKSTLLYDPDHTKWIPLSDAKRELPKLYESYKEGKIDSKDVVHFRIGNVFDISQTDFPKDKYPELLSMGHSSEHHDILIKAMTEYAKNEHGIEVQSADLQSIELRGLSYNGVKRVDINERLESTQYLSTLNHELGHQLLHHHTNKPTNIVEFEADVFSIMLDYHMGIDVTDPRKEHIVSSYKSILKDLDTNNIKELFDDLFENVFRVFSAEVDKIDQHIDKHISYNKNQKIEKSNDIER